VLLTFFTKLGNLRLILRGCLTNQDDLFVTALMKHLINGELPPFLEKLTAFKVLSKKNPSDPHPINAVFNEIIPAISQTYMIFEVNPLIVKYLVKFAHELTAGLKNFILHIKDQLKPGPLRQLQVTLQHAVSNYADNYKIVKHGLTAILYIIDLVGIDFSMHHFLANLVETALRATQLNLSLDLIRDVTAPLLSSVFKSRIVISDTTFALSGYKLCEEKAKDVKMHYSQAYPAEMSTLQAKKLHNTTRRRARHDRHAKLFPDPRRPCQYGDKCYRKNPSHFLEFRHPKDKLHYSKEELARFAVFNK